MLSEEILRKVRQIEVTTRRVIDDMVSGQYRSHFKGHGVQFSEHRQYVAGDDVRHIDWKVSARTKEPLVKKYEEERELTVLLVIDGSQSTAFGSKKKTKNEVLGEVAGLIAYAASMGGDKVGALIFSGQVEKILPPKKGRSQVQRLIREILGFVPKSKGTGLSAALDSAGRLMKHSGIIFVLSDFMAIDYQRSIQRLSRKHDVVALQVMDPLEESFPQLGSVWVRDLETGKEQRLDTSSEIFKKWVMKAKEETGSELQKALQGSRVESIALKTHEDFLEALVRFFRARSRRRR